MKQHGITYLLANFEVEMVQLKLDMEAFIKDKDIPLAERWDVWVKAPDSLKNTNDYYYDMQLGDIDLIDQSHNDLDRRQVINVVDFLDNAIDIIYNDLADQTLEGGMPSRENFKPAGLDELKEHILSSNMGSFIYDW
jgi:hypothetical protein